MGVPAFFRWLSRKYPSVVVECYEQKSRDYDGNDVEIDYSQPNPNGVEFDNLYLDMNGIIHPCTHPEDKPAPKNEDEMMLAIFEAIDRLFRIVRPRKILYMAIDGVAPRAKMNQQRSRRFRASKESKETIFELARIRRELRERGINIPEDPRADHEHFDSNCITPGTPFMDRLSTCLHFYIHQRLNSDPGWQNIKVILSDANVPGEGEHKIMDFIRRQRAQPDHDPNTRHCLCGADADLIMLGLATHEVNFTIIREEFKPNKPKPCPICGSEQHALAECKGEGLTQPDDDGGHCPKPVACEVNFIFVRLNVLREYLRRELAMPNLPFSYDFERAIDDWVFMCFFVGNDFLPHLPSLEIREGAIDRLVRLYKQCVYRTKGFLTEDGNVDLNKVQIIMTELGKVEDEIFKKRQENEKRFRAQNKARKRQKTSGPDFNLLNNTQFAPKTISEASTTLTNVKEEAMEIRKRGMAKQGFEQFLEMTGLEEQHDAEMHIAREKLKRKRQSDDVRLRDFGNVDEEDDEDEEDEDKNDEVRLWEAGFKDRYYESKFDVESDNHQFRYDVAEHYIRGLCWVMKYYYQGCASWEWYFPYHYAPFASDFTRVGAVKIDFPNNTKPFNPLEQLMAVFPASSCSHIPRAWHYLMLNSESTIIDFYPQDFKIDLNGKKFAWQGVALLPFVDEKRLFDALKPFYERLNAEEVERNQLGYDRLYLGAKHNSFNFVRSLYEQKIDLTVQTKISFDGMQGSICLCTKHTEIGGSLNAPVEGLEKLKMNQVVCVKFTNNSYGYDYVYKAIQLKGAIQPPDVLKPKDLNAMDSRNWRPQIGMAPATQRVYVSDAGHRMLNFQNLNAHDQQQRPLGYSNDRNNRFGSNNRGFTQPSASTSQNYSSAYAANRSPYTFRNNQHQQHQQQQQQQQQSYRHQTGHFNNNRSAPYNYNSNNQHQPYSRAGHQQVPFRPPPHQQSRYGHNRDNRFDGNRRPY